MNIGAVLVIGGLAVWAWTQSRKNVDTSGGPCTNDPPFRSVPFRWEEPLGGETDDMAEPVTEHFQIEPRERQIISTAEDPDMIQALYRQQDQTEETFHLRNSNPVIDQRHLH